MRNGPAIQVFVVAAAAVVAAADVVVDVEQSTAEVAVCRVLESSTVVNNGPDDLTQISRPMKNIRYEAYDLYTYEKDTPMSIINMLMATLKFKYLVSVE